ncbi:MAG: hypothetical protein HeimC3_24050 [Candidatus Heimdallarchaeota archaeon LC_3]|nr:MAG: hypothetical protein HeimC3_24050 [Candidatus Heimdallarchaeota archaeon LC_3]
MNNERFCFFIIFANFSLFKLNKQLEFNQELFVYMLGNFKGNVLNIKNQFVTNLLIIYYFDKQLLTMETEFYESNR